VGLGLPRPGAYSLLGPPRATLDPGRRPRPFCGVEEGRGQRRRRRPDWRRSV